MLAPSLTDPMIRDILQFRQAGYVCRRVEDLPVPVPAWRAAMRCAAHRDGTGIRTFMSAPAGAQHDPDRLVCAVRTDAATDGTESRTDPLWWRRVDELPVAVATWRAMLRRVARREGVGIRTFLIPAGCDEPDDITGQLVYVVWINTGPVPVERAATGSTTHDRSSARPAGCTAAA